MAPNQIWQIDIFILQKFVKHNRGFRDILCAIDVFTRKVYCVAMKTKDIDDCTNALDSIIKKSGVKPMTIMSDNDSSFKGEIFQALLKKHEIAHDMNIVGDHHALGIVDRFARTIKTVLTKLFIRTIKTNWIDSLDRIVNRYNEMPHTGILDIKPNDAENQIKPLLELNNEKGNKINSDLEEGDKVRINIRTTFDKGTAPRWSDEVFVVKSATGLSITLTNGAVQKREQLLKVSKETVVEQVANAVNAIKKASVENKKERILKEEGVEKKNIIKSSRRKVVAPNNIVGDIDVNNILVLDAKVKSGRKTV